MLDQPQGSIPGDPCLGGNSPCGMRWGLDPPQMETGSPRGQQNRVPCVEGKGGCPGGLFWVPCVEVNQPQAVAGLGEMRPGCPAWRGAEWEMLFWGAPCVLTLGCSSIPQAEP